MSRSFASIEPTNSILQKKNPPEKVGSVEFGSWDASHYLVEPEKLIPFDKKSTNAA